MNSPIFKINPLAKFAITAFSAETTRNEVSCRAAASSKLAGVVSSPLIRECLPDVLPEPISHIANRQVSINNVIVSSQPRTYEFFFLSLLTLSSSLLSVQSQNKKRRNPSITPYFACVCILHHTLAFSQCHQQNICNSQAQQTIP